MGILSVSANLLTVFRGKSRLFYTPTATSFTLWALKFNWGFENSQCSFWLVMNNKTPAIRMRIITLLMMKEPQQNPVYPCIIWTVVKKNYMREKGRWSIYNKHFFKKGIFFSRYILYPLIIPSYIFQSPRHNSAVHCKGSKNEICKLLERVYKFLI